MFVKFVLATATAACVVVLMAPPALADTLDTASAKKTHRHRRAAADGYEGASMPTRGMSMAQVEKRFGAPSEKLSPAGGDAPRHPTINRWRYAGYTVYFERSRVIHSVVDEAPASKS